jgi:3-mercaptopyruvate sulfurtransferase SseA
MNVEAITAEEAQGRLDAGEAVVFIDARNEDVWKSSEWQIPSSRRVPPDQVEAHLDDVPLADLIVPYAGSAEDAFKVAHRLAEYGWPNVRPLRGGHEDWRAAGYPTESKPPQSSRSKRRRPTCRKPKANRQVLLLVGRALMPCGHPPHDISWHPARQRALRTAAASPNSVVPAINRPAAST